MTKKRLMKIKKWEDVETLGTPDKNGDIIVNNGGPIQYYYKSLYNDLPKNRIILAERSGFGWVWSPDFNVEHYISEYDVEEFVNPNNYPEYFI